MISLDMVNLTALMERTAGRPDIVVGLIDGPVATMHPDLTHTSIREIPADNNGGTCKQPNSMACLHGTLVAGTLSAKRGSVAPSICPDCTLLIHPIFLENASIQTLPSAQPKELAVAILSCVDAGAHVVNLSLALAQPSSKEEPDLKAALDYAAHRGILVVAAAGNQGTLGSTTITRHPWVIPVVACTNFRQPMNASNLGGSIGRCGLCAPGDNVMSLGAEGQPLTFGGTSAAAPFVTGTIALLWSLFPDATSAQIKLALTQAHQSRRATVVPPLLDAWAAYQVLANGMG